MNRGPNNPAEDVLIDVQSALGVPFTNLLFHKLASWPQVLAVLWRHASPIVLTSNFAKEADRLRGMALMQTAAKDFEWPPDMAVDDIKRVMRFTDAFLLVQPQLLLLVAGWARALGGSNMLEGDQVDRRLERREAPGRGDLSADIPLIEMPPIDRDTADVFQAMVDERGHPGVASYYRGLANWPPLLRECWRIIRTSLTDRQQRARDLVQAADSAAFALGLHSIHAPLEQTESIQSMLCAWRDIQVPQLMLDTAQVKISLPVLARREAVLGRDGL
jgi:Halocarboxylic acid dehydrogenase DehI